MSAENGLPDELIFKVHADIQRRRPRTLTPLEHITEPYAFFIREVTSKLLKKPNKDEYFLGDEEFRSKTTEIYGFQGFDSIYFYHAFIEAVITHQGDERAEKSPTGILPFLKSWHVIRIKKLNDDYHEHMDSLAKIQSRLLATDMKLTSASLSLDYLMTARRLGLKLGSLFWEKEIDPNKVRQTIDQGSAILKYLRRDLRIE